MPEIDDGVAWEQLARLDALPAQRVAFVDGRLGEAVEAEWARRGEPAVFAVGTNAGRIDAAVARIPAARSWSRARMHVPRELAEEAVADFDRSGAALLVAVGGGSAIGFAKWIAHRRGVPILAAPTTLAGSEGTASFGVTLDARKHVEVDPRVLPEAIVYDSSVIVATPRPLLVASAYNALAHAIDSLWTPRADDAIRASALVAVEQIVGSLTAEEPPARAGDLQRGAYRSALVFAAAGSGLHHRLCHVLGGAFGLDHAATHAALLPYTTTFQAERGPAVRPGLETAMRATSVPAGLSALAVSWGVPATLSDVGLTADLIPAAAEAAAEALTAYPDVSTDDIRAILDAAWSARDLTEFQKGCLR